MKNKIKQFYRLLSVIILFTVIFIYSCELDEGQNGVSLDGVWSCHEDHQDFGESTYTIDIEESGTDIRIYNFLQLGSSVSALAHVSGKSVTIPDQIIDNHEIKGSGIISSDYNTITIQHTDDDGTNDQAAVTSVYTRQ